MKTPITIMLILCSYSYSMAQHLGNFNNQAQQLQLSRANISQGHMDDIAVNKAIHHQYNLQPSDVLSINLRSLYNIEATDYTAVFNINQVGKTAQQATQLMNDKIDVIKQQLTAAGFKGSFAVDMISFVPQYEIEVEKKLFSKTYTEVPVGFELQQNLMISYNDDSDFTNILAACASAEVYNLVKVDYYVSDLETIYADLQQRLLDLVQQKKKYYTALGFDMTNYNVHMADAKYYHMPKDYYKSYVAANNISLDAVSGSKTIARVKKPVSYYYDPIPHAGYDIVVNPAITKPVIQLGMDLSLRYTIKPEQPEPPKPPIQTPKPKVYIISPNGSIDIKQLPNS